MSTDDERKIGEVTITADIMSGYDGSDGTNPPAPYMVLRFADASMVITQPAMDPAQEVAEWLVYEVTNGDVDPDSLLNQVVDVLAAKHTPPAEDEGDLPELLENLHADPTATPLSGEEAVGYRPVPQTGGTGEYPITFGTQYGATRGSDLHPVLGIYGARSGYLIVEASSREEARERAFATIGKAWAFDYASVDDLDPNHFGWYPLGEIARITADGFLIVHDQKSED